MYSASLAVSLPDCGSRPREVKINTQDQCPHVRDVGDSVILDQ
jgi:hypothetical protein